jgi:hypothetical protein
MYKYLILFIFFVYQVDSFSQVGNSFCTTAIQVCPNVGATFPASTDSPAAEAGPDYGCLGSQPNPAWFYFQVNTPGLHDIAITNSNDNDLDYIIWGPFVNLSEYCNQLTDSNIASCSYAGGTSETASFISQNSGDYYILLITNFSNQNTNVNFIQTSGQGSFNCEFTAPCLITLTTAFVGSCDSLTNLYNVTGQIYNLNPPQNGTLIVSCLGVTSEYNAQLSSPFPYSLNGLPSNGANATISYQFSANTGCNATRQILAPPGCLPCNATVTQNGPVCEGENIEFQTAFSFPATYLWSGPNEYTSSAQNPIINNVTGLNAGEYTVLITGQNCVAQRTVNVEVISVPKPSIFEAGTQVCEGEILFLGAAEVPGAQFEWTGPNGFNSNSRNTQILNSSPENSGTYIVQITLNNCSNRSDTVQAIVFASPNISINGDSILFPNSTSIFNIEGGGEGFDYFWIFSGNTGIINNTIFTSDKDSLVIFWKDLEGEISIQVIAQDTNGCESKPKLMNVLVTNSAGIGKVYKNELLIYPNPTKDRLFLNFSEGEYTIFDAASRAVIKGNVLKEKSFIDLDVLVNGIYFINLKNSKGNFWSKIVVEK